MDRELFGHIVELAQSSPIFPRILNCDLRPVLQHARVSSPNGGASNVFISGIPYALDSYRQFIIPVYAVFFRTQQRIPIPPGGTKEIIASILSQNRTLQGYFRDRVDSVRQITTVAMDEPDDGMNVAIFNAEGPCSTITNWRLSSILITFKSFHKPICFMINSCIH
jgi:hypothetical protein